MFIYNFIFSKKKNEERFKITYTFVFGINHCHFIHGVGYYMSVYWFRLCLNARLFKQLYNGKKIYRVNMNANKMQTSTRILATTVNADSFSHSLLWIAPIIRVFMGDMWPCSYFLSSLKESLIKEIDPFLFNFDKNKRTK